MDGQVKRGGHEARSIRRISGGFSLVELLVVVTILVILSMAVFSLYIGGVRANKWGRQVIAAQEESRAAFDVVERDLGSAFTSRDYGKYYTFYGAPYGMMFVGLVRGEQDVDDPEENLQRVTYVLRRSDASPVFIKDAEATDGTEVITCALLRYVEPAVEDIDTFAMYDSSGTPLSWQDLVDGWAGEFPALAGLNDYDDSRFRTYADAVATAATLAPDDPLRKVYGTDSQATYDTIKEIRIAAKRRETWLKMLAKFPGYPDGWQFLRSDDASDDDPLDPNKYLVADNIVVRYAPGGSIVPLDVSGAETFFFRYGRLGVDRIALEPASQWLDVWDSEANVIDPASGDVVGLAYMDVAETRAGARNAAGSPLAARLPQAVHMMMTFRYESPYVGAPDTLRKIDQVIDVPSGYTRSRL